MGSERLIVDIEWRLGIKSSSGTRREKGLPPTISSLNKAIRKLEARFRHYTREDLHNSRAEVDRTALSLFEDVGPLIWKDHGTKRFNWLAQADDEDKVWLADPNDPRMWLMHDSHIKKLDKFNELYPEDLYYSRDGPTYVTRSRRLRCADLW